MNVMAIQAIRVLRIFNFPPAKGLEIVDILKILKSDPHCGGWDTFSSVVEYILSVSHILSIFEMQAMPCNTLRSSVSTIYGILNRFSDAFRRHSCRFRNNEKHTRKP